MSLLRAAMLSDGCDTLSVLVVPLDGWSCKAEGTAASTRAARSTVTASVDSGSIHER